MVLTGQWPFRVSWSPTVKSQGKKSLGPEKCKVGNGGAPVLELHHLLLPRTQAPSLGADGEDAVVFCTHLVELSAVKLYLLCPHLQVNLLVTWKEEGPGEGFEVKVVKLCQDGRIRREEEF